MSQSEELSLQDRVVNFLCDRGEGRIAYEEDQEETAKVLKSLAFKTCLPEIPLLFDNMGNMYLDLSEEDTVLFKGLFQKRWPVVEDALQKHSDIFDALPVPEKPYFVDVPELDYLRRMQESGDEVVLSALSGELRAYYEGFLLQEEFFNEAAVSCFRTIRAKMKDWARENKDYDFPSVAGRSRFTYDVDRELSTLVP